MPWGQRPVPNPKPVLSWDEAAERITHDGVAWHDSDPLSQTTITFGFLRENEGGPIGGYSAAMKAQARRWRGWKHRVGELHGEHMVGG
jgi:hypothetical protein